MMLAVKVLLLGHTGTCTLRAELNASDARKGIRFAFLGEGGYRPGNEMARVIKLNGQSVLVQSEETLGICETGMLIKDTQAYLLMCAFQVPWNCD